MLRWICGEMRQDWIRNERNMETVKVGLIGRKIQKSRLRLFGYMKRRNENYIGKGVGKMEMGGRR